MFELFGYITLILSIVGAVLIVIYIQSYLLAFIFFWIGLTIASMLILHFKQN